jgi:hypothetical protein
VRDYARLHALVQSRAGASPCGVCGNTTWRTTVRIVRLPLVSEEDGSTEAEGPEAMIFACKHCGHVRLFLLSVLEELAAEAGNGAPPA